MSICSQWATAERNQVAHQPSCSLVNPGILPKRAATWFLPSHFGNLFMYSWIGSKTGTASDLMYSSMSCLGDFFSPIPNFLARRTMELKASAVSTFQFFSSGLSFFGFSSFFSNSFSSESFFSSGLMQKNSVFPFKTFLRKR